MRKGPTPLSLWITLDNSIVKADTPVKTDMEKTNTYSRLEKAASYDDRDQKELDRVSEIIHETGNCKFCHYQCPNPAGFGAIAFNGPPDIWDHMEKHHPKEYEWFSWRALDANYSCSENVSIV